MNSKMQFALIIALSLGFAMPPLASTQTAGTAAQPTSDRLRTQAAAQKKAGEAKE
jgi:hypothetical protein